MTEQVLTALQRIRIGSWRPRRSCSGIAAVVLIANTIRLSIFARRREVEVMKLVGRDQLVRPLPFMLEGMLPDLGRPVRRLLLAAVYTALKPGSTAGLPSPPTCSRAA